MHSGPWPPVPGLSAGQCEHCAAAGCHVLTHMACANHLQHIQYKLANKDSKFNVVDL